jgi:hypothetical protein
MNALSGVEMTKSVPLLLIWCYAALIVLIIYRDVACFMICLHFYLNGEGLSCKEVNVRITKQTDN